MLLNLTMHNAAGDDERSVRMRLDFDQLAWSVDNEDAWEAVGYSDRGAFEFKPANGAIWLWDQGNGGPTHNTVIIRDAPSDESDVAHLSGTARIADPKDDAFKDGQIEWTVDTEGEAADDPVPPHVSDRRLYVRAVLLPRVLGALGTSKYGDPEFTELTNGLSKDNPEVVKANERAKPYGGHFTTCGYLPGYVAKQLGDPGQVQLNGPSLVRSEGQKYGAWVTADGTTRPQPGDLFALLAPSVTDKENGLIAHVGVIVDASGDRWKTADAGQGDDGFVATYLTRNYDAAAGTLSEDIRWAGNAIRRVLAGWIDIDKYPFTKM